MKFPTSFTLSLLYSFRLLFVKLYWPRSNITDDVVAHRIRKSFNWLYMRSIIKFFYFIFTKHYYSQKFSFYCLNYLVRCYFYVVNNIKTLLLFAHHLQWPSVTSQQPLLQISHFSIITSNHFIVIYFNFKNFQFLKKDPRISSRNVQLLCRKFLFVGPNQPKYM